MPKPTVPPIRFIAASVLGAGVLLAGVAAPAGASMSAAFKTGDVVVYEVGTSGGATPSSSSAAVSLVGYSPAGAVDTTVGLPTADSGTTHALTESGTATNDGELSLSADGQSLLATGYDAAPGVAKITSAGSTGRTVGVVSAAGVVDTSTSLTDSTTEGPPATPANFRSATSPTGAASTIYAAGAAGVGITPDGGSSAAYLNSDNVHQVQIVAGQLYDSTTTAINAVGAGVPTSGTPTDTSLLTTTPTGFDPDGFALVTVGSGTSPNVLYVADNANNAVEKYSLEAGVWTETGSFAVFAPEGVTAVVNGTNVTVYATGATATGSKFANALYSLTDASGPTGTLGGTPGAIVTAPAGMSFKGVALAPTASAVVAAPEAPVAIVLPVAGGAILLAGGVLRRRRRGLA